MATSEERTRFLQAALWHGSLDGAHRLLAEHPDLVGADIHVAAVLGDEASVIDLLAADPGSVFSKSPPYDGDPLTYLCLSKYLRFDVARGNEFLRTARTLLDAGADPNAGFWHKGEHETALYGAAGVAHHGALTRLLIERGADPNDPEVVYHTPEDWDMEALRAVVETGQLTPESLALMLLRKHDWHHTDGVRYLLEHGANPNLAHRRWVTPLAHAIQRDNDLPIIALLIDHGADFAARHPELPVTPLGLAARRGRGDILQLVEQRGKSFPLAGLDALLAACATGNEDAIRGIELATSPIIDELKRDGGQILAEFAGNDNARGVELLLDLGISVDARFHGGDGYWGVAPESTALHVAAWRASHETARRLIRRGADVNASDGKGHSPLVLAIRACVDSYWTEWRQPDTVAALLAAGASVEGIPEKTGYDEVDALIATHRRPVS